jgi:hypothetical protein
MGVNVLCFYSSFIFLTNIIFNLINKQYLYAYLFIYLLITSLLLHSNDESFIFNIIDKTAILSVLIFSIFNYCNIVNKNFKNENLYISSHHVL